MDVAPPEQIVSHLVECAQEQRGCSVVGVSAPYATAMADDARLREAFLQADLLVPDGQGFAWACSALGVPCGARLAIPDLCERLLEEGQQRGWKVFIYGASEEVNRLACANVARRFPALKCVAGQQGYGQGQAEEEAVIARLKDEGFNLLIVARPSPDKEAFLARCCRNAGVVGLAAGGYAEILAGKTRRAPAPVQAVGLEWLYRVIQEPRRLWKRIGWANARFVAAVLWAHLRMPATRPPWGCPAVHVAAIVLAICAAYSTSLNVPYHFDDPEYILDNPAIRSFDRLREIKVLSFRKLWWLSNALCYRLSQLYGNHTQNKPDVRVFHAWNVGCHLIAALALFGLLRRVLRPAGTTGGQAASGTRPASDTGPPNGAAGTPYDLAAAVAAAIFAAHPLCTEAVTYICGRDNGQGGMFYLLGLYASAVAFERATRPCTKVMSAGVLSTERPARNGETQYSVLSTQYYVFSWPAWFWPAVWTMALGACAVLTKESHLTFPGAVGLVYLFFYRGAQRHTVSNGLLLGIISSMVVLAWGAAGRREGRLGLAFQIVLLLIAAGAVLGRPEGEKRNEKREKSSHFSLLVSHFLRRRLNLNWALLATVVGLGIAAIAAFPYAYERTWGALTGFSDSDYVRSLCSQAYAVPWLLLRAVVPYGLNIDHDFPTIAHPNDPRAIAGGAVILLLLVFGAVGAWRRWLGGFGVLLALLSIAPSNTVIERGDIVSERNFYLAAAGGACLIAWLLAACMSRIAAFAEARKSGDTISPATGGSAAPSALLYEAGLWTAVLGCCLAGPFASFTVLRNNDWGDPFRLWDAARRRSPEKLRVLYNYGIAAAARRLYDQADTAFSNVIRIGEAKAENQLFRADESVQVKCFHMAYANLANLQVRRYVANADKDGSAQLRNIDDIYKRGLERTAYDPDLTYTYASLLLQLGRASDAAQVLQHSLNLHDWAEELYYPLGLACLETNRLAEAGEHLGRALGVQEHHSLGVSWEQPAAKRAEICAFLGLTKVLLKERVEGKNDLRKSLELDPQGVLMMLTNGNRARNSKLKPIEMSQPDSLVIALSITRREVLEAVLQSCDEALQACPEKEQAVLRMLRGVVDNELRRRGAYQKKRIQFGFMDDPEAE